MFPGDFSGKVSLTSEFSLNSLCDWLNSNDLLFAVAGVLCMVVLKYQQLFLSSTMRVNLKYCEGGQKSSQMKSRKIRKYRDMFSRKSVIKQLTCYLYYTAFRKIYSSAFYSPNQIALQSSFSL